MSAEKFALEKSGEGNLDNGVIAQNDLFIRRIIDVKDGTKSEVDLTNAEVKGIFRAGGPRFVRYVVDIPRERKPQKENPQLRMGMQL